MYQLSIHLNGYNTLTTMMVSETRPGSRLAPKDAPTRYSFLKSPLKLLMRLKLTTYEIEMSNVLEMDQLISSIKNPSSNGILITNYKFI